MLIKVGMMLCLCLLAGLCANAEEWRIQEGPLMTRWAKEVSPDKVHPEYPRPQMVREDWMNLNGLWQFAPASEGEKPPLGKALDDQILVPFPMESALSGIMAHHERVWYRRTFNVDPWIEAGHRVLLHFGAVDWESLVWINGTGRHYLGTGFSGWKNSGLGREECLDELLSYTQTKAVHIIL